MCPTCYSKKTALKNCEVNKSKRFQDFNQTCNLCNKK